MDPSLRLIESLTGQRRTYKLKTRRLNELYNWARDTVLWHWSPETLFDRCQLHDHNMVVQGQV